MLKLISKFPYSKVIYTLIIISVLVGILVLIGWKTENYFLKTSGLGTLAMKPNSALLFIFSGITLFLLQLKSNNINLFIIRFLSIVIFLIGALSFLQHHFIINFGIDELLIKNKNGIENSIRMTSTAAFNFILIGLSLFLVSFQQFKKIILLSIFVYTVLTLSFISISAHFLGQIDLVNFTIFTFMPYSTSIIFMIVSIGIIITVYKDPTIISSIERKLYSGLIVSIIFIAFIVSTSINSIQSFIVLSKKIDQIEIKKIELDKILIKSHDLTANIRGFIFSHEEKFLDQSFQNKVAINESINQLELLNKNNPAELASLKELKLLIKERIDYAEYSINKSLYTPLNDDDEVLLTIEGERLTNKIDDFIIKMLEEENRQNNEYTLLEIKNSDTTKKIIYIGAFVQFLLLFLIYMFVKKDISGRRKVEKSLQELNENLDEKVKERTLTLKESEEHFRYNLDNMLEGCQIINFDWQYIFLNKAAEKQNKRPNDSLIGKVIMNEWPGIDTSEVFKMMKLCMESRISTQNDIEYIFPDGSKEWFDISIDPTPQGVFIRSQNITERKHAEEKILNINIELEQKVEIRTKQLEEINTKLNEAPDFIILAKKAAIKL